MKFCGKCNTIKPHTEFHKNNMKGDGFQAYCAECRNALNRLAYRTHPKTRGERRSRQLKKLYGITGEQWDRLFLSQGSVCAICESNEPKTERGWSTDHCHASLIVRGILCHPCNVVVGYVEKGWPILIQEIEDYLLKSRLQPPVLA